MYRVAMVEDDAEQAEALARMIDGFPRRDELSVTRLSSLPELESYTGGGSLISC
ncbi:hypothetical protein [Arabiibacter massiliensis]|uniref:hypothetical protein n=1 Tax=Arabiibacter massiliensis TaxID=1870985 RepID=UPI00155AA37C|nr:hypothetical protein [Arabiibacter massiliensis]